MTLSHTGKELILKRILKQQFRWSRIQQNLFSKKKAHLDYNIHVHKTKVIKVISLLKLKRLYWQEVERLQWSSNPEPSSLLG